MHFFQKAKATKNNYGSLNDDGLPLTASTEQETDQQLECKHVLLNVSESKTDKPLGFTAIEQLKMAINHEAHKNEAIKNLHQIRKKISSLCQRLYPKKERGCLLLNDILNLGSIGGTAYGSTHLSSQNDESGTSAAGGIVLLIFALCLLVLFLWRKHTHYQESFYIKNTALNVDDLTVLNENGIPINDNSMVNDVCLSIDARCIQIASENPSDILSIVDGYLPSDDTADADAKNFIALMRR